jgi:hypothetical protein
MEGRHEFPLGDEVNLVNSNYVDDAKAVDTVTKETQVVLTEGENSPTSVIEVFENGMKAMPRDTGWKETAEWAKSFVKNWIPKSLKASDEMIYFLYGTDNEYIDHDEMKRCFASLIGTWPEYVFYVGGSDQLNSVSWMRMYLAVHREKLDVEVQDLNMNKYEIHGVTPKVRQVDLRGLYGDVSKSLAERVVKAMEWRKKLYDSGQGVPDQIFVVHEAWQRCGLKSVAPQVDT